MILPDVNVWVYAHRAEMPQHAAYSPLVAEMAEGTAPFGMSTLTMASFVRIVTNSRIFPDATPVSSALAVVDRLRASPMSRWVEPGPRWWSIFSRLCRDGNAKGNLVPDAALAALAIENGCELLTADRGFGRYPGLRWRHPLDA